MSTTTAITAAAAGGLLAVGLIGAAPAATAAPAASQGAKSSSAKQARILAMKRQIIALPSGRKLPIRDFSMSSGFGHHSGPHADHAHEGQDFAARTGTPIYSATAGKVVLARSYYGYGNLVEVRTSAGSTILYAHQSRILVKKGQRVHAGQKLGKVGSTGHSTGPHLHFEVRTKHDRAVNPLKYLGLSAGQLTRLDHKLDRLR